MIARSKINYLKIIGINIIINKLFFTIFKEFNHIVIVCYCGQIQKKSF
jgi:hypothetical protein